MSKELPKGTIKATGKKRPPDNLPVYPGFLFKEFLAALGCLLILALLGLLVEAPLDVPANPDFTPNPAKSPWYFLGIQELLVYFDPWLAGVVIPLLIISGLISIPLLDIDPKGAGHYSFRRRIWATLPLPLACCFWLCSRRSRPGSVGQTGTGTGPGNTGAWPSRPNWSLVRYRVGSACP